MLFLLAGCGSEKVNEQVAVESLKELEVTNELDLGLTPEEFKSRYNKIAVNIDAPVIKSDAFFIKPSDNYFDFFGEFKNGVFIGGSINTSGKIESLMASADIYSQYSTAFSKSKNIFATIIYTFSPEIGASEVWDMVEVFEKDKNRYSELSTEKIIYARVIVLEDEEILMFMLKPKKINPAEK